MRKRKCAFCKSTRVSMMRLASGKPFVRGRFVLVACLDCGHPWWSKIPDGDSLAKELEKRVPAFAAWVGEAGRGHREEQLPRTSDGFINNCALANDDHEENCQMCGGRCPDRRRFEYMPHLLSKKGGGEIPDPDPSNGEETAGDSDPGEP